MKRREPLSLDLTPLLDVVFILIIFFMVSSTFKTQEKILNLTLPSSDGTTLEIQTKQITLELTQKDLAYNGQLIDFLSLQNTLNTLQDKTKPIIVRIDSQVPYDRVIKLLNLLQLNEFHNLSLVTNEK